MANSIGSVIQRLREERGLSRLGIHKKTNGAINVNWLSSLEKGRIKHPAPAKLAPLAEMLGTSVLEIYREADFMEFPFPSEDPEEQELVRIYRQLSPIDRRRARRLLQVLSTADDVDKLATERVNGQIRVDKQSAA